MCIIYSRQSERQKVHGGDSGYKTDSHSRIGSASKMTGKNELSQEFVLPRSVRQRRWSSTRY